MLNMFPRLDTSLLPHPVPDASCCLPLPRSVLVLCVDCWESRLALDDRSVSFERLGLDEHVITAIIVKRIGAARGCDEATRVSRFSMGRWTARDYT